MYFWKTILLYLNQFCRGVRTEFSQGEYFETENSGSRKLDDGKYWNIPENPFLYRLTLLEWNPRIFSFELSWFDIYFCPGIFFSFSVPGNTAFNLVSQDLLLFVTCETIILDCKRVEFDQTFLSIQRSTKKKSFPASLSCLLRATGTPVTNCCAKSKHSSSIWAIRSPTSKCFLR